MLWRCSRRLELHEWRSPGGSEDPQELNVFNKRIPTNCLVIPLIAYVQIVWGYICKSNRSELESQEDLYIWQVPLYNRTKKISRKSRIRYLNTIQDLKTSNTLTKTYQNILKQLRTITDNNYVEKYFKFLLKNYEPKNSTHTKQLLLKKMSSPKKL